MKSICLDDLLHKRIKMLSAITGKKIYKLIEEAVEYLEKKYSEKKNE